MMKRNINKLNDNVKLIVIAFICILGCSIIYHALLYVSYYTQITPIGSKNKEKPIEISQGTILNIHISIGKIDTFSPIVVYWDDEKDLKHEINKHLFVASEEIKVPDSIGVHKLTIERYHGKRKFEYYYYVSQ